MKLHYLLHFPKRQANITLIGNIELAKFRRNLVLKNLFENKFLNEKYQKLKNEKINFKKKKKFF